MRANEGQKNEAIKRVHLLLDFTNTAGKQCLQTRRRVVTRRMGWVSGLRRATQHRLESMCRRQSSRDETSRRQEWRETPSLIPVCDLLPAITSSLALALHRHRALIPFIEIISCSLPRVKRCPLT